MQTWIATRDDFLSCVGSVVASPDKQECNAYSSRFFEKLNGVDEFYSERTTQVFTFLGVVCSMQFTLDTPSDPLGPMVIYRDGRGTTVDDFDDVLLAFLAEIVADITDPELQARIADVLFIRQPQLKFGEIAVNAYLRSVARLETSIVWPPVIDRLARSLQIAFRCRRKVELFNLVVAHIETSLDKSCGDSTSYFTWKLMELLLEYRAGDPTLQSSRSQALALKAEQAKDWDKARTYWQVTASWHKANKDKEGARTALIHEAESHVSEATQSALSSAPSYMLACHHLQSAIEALRRISGMKERVKEIHALLLDYQERSIGELGQFSSTVDIGDIVQKALDAVRGKPLFESLIALVNLFAVPSVTSLREQAEEHRRDYLLQRLFPKVMLNSMGRVVARQPQTEEEAIEADMYHNSSTSRSLYVQAIIEPVRDLIVSEHRVRYSDLKAIVVKNPFVRPGREAIVARGIHAGIQGDFLVSTHLLEPQLEDSIRYYLTRTGVITSGLSDAGIQKEHNLNNFLSEVKYAEPLRQTIGDDMVFDMRGLLVEQFGSNLRNDTAHGLIDHDAFYSAPSVYLWWLALRFYMLPMLAVRFSNEDPEETT